MFEFLFDIPLIISGPAVIAFLCLFAIGGLLLVRRYVLPRLRIHTEDAHFTGTMVHSVMVFYGLAVALIAVNVFETYADVSKIVSQEATSAAVLYHDVSAYPDPIRSQLQKELRDYVYQVIHEAWPLQRGGQIPSRGVVLMTHFQDTMMTFDPATIREQIVHAEAFRAYNNMTQARRLRVDAVSIGLPGVMWTVILVGAVISLTSSFFFKVEDERLHLILVVLLATFIGLVIFMIVAFDRPFRGDLGVGSEPYQLVYDHLMTP